MKNKLLLGSANPNKAKELAALLEGLPWCVIGLQDLPAVAAPEETGTSFFENAVLKARYYSEHFNIPCVADDSGLEVDALGGAPGIFSSIYAGDAATDAENNAKLLTALENYLWHERTARFVCAAAFYQSGEPPHVEFGEVRGHIAIAPYGHNGFGYDPLFVPEGYECTFAELSPEEKHSISHRGQAFRKLRAWLERRL